MGWQVLMWCENKNSAQKWCINYGGLEGDWGMALVWKGHGYWLCEHLLDKSF